MSRVLSSGHELRPHAANGVIARPMPYCSPDTAAVVADGEEEIVGKGDVAVEPGGNNGDRHRKGHSAH